MIAAWFQHIEFKYPWFLWVMAVIPVMIGYYRRSARNPSAVRWSSFRDLPKEGSLRTRLIHLSLVLKAMMVLLMVLALARPQQVWTEEKITGEGIDIILCMDISGSMLAQDFQPNRLDAAKEVAARFIEGRKTDRIGLVIFSGESYTLCPPTTDYNTLQSQLSALNSGMLEDGTAIGSGLTTALARLKQSRCPSRIIILLTDGENNTGFAPLTAMELARTLGVKVYTIGVGTTGFAPVPERDENGSVTVRNQKVNLDETFLRQLAGVTGARYFRATNNTSLQDIYAAINKMEKSKVERRVRLQYTDRYQPLVWLAIVLLFADLLLQYTLFRKIP